jgi:hypothetical protein
MPAVRDKNNEGLTGGALGGGGINNRNELNVFAARRGLTCRYDIAQSGPVSAPMWIAQLYRECCHYISNECKIFIMV